MSENEALDEATLVSVGEACTELALHSVEYFVAVRCGVRCLIDIATNDTIAAVDTNGCVHSADVMHYLGY